MKGILLTLSSSFLLMSCVTYHISTQSLMEQFAHAQKETKTTLFIAPPYVFFPGIVDGNSLKEIKVLDKNERAFILPVTNHTSVKITKNDGAHTTFYFNTLLLQDSTITGSKTHFFEAHIRPIKFMDIAKIELQ
ncbi:MAG: hypothetical protein JSS82_03995 [Bacteroidetes bacterium]|nr:hypothetical protein [Bacteroidota bacterium]